MGSHEGQQNVGEPRVNEVGSGKLGGHKEDTRGEIPGGSGNGVLGSGTPFAQTGFPPSTKVKTFIRKGFRLSTS